jgi:acetyl-CoA C-acetyltransferase
MAALPPLSESSLLTAAVASQISDGAAALLVASARAVRRHGLPPLARVHTMAVVGSDPVLMLAGPIPATSHPLKSTGLTLDEIGVYEVNEAFAPRRPRLAGGDRRGPTRSAAPLRSGTRSGQPGPAQ